MMAAQLNSQQRVKLVRFVTLTFTCLLLLPAPAHADEGAECRPQSTQDGRARALPRGSRGAPQRPQPAPLTKEVLVNTLEMGRGERRNMTLAEFRDRIQKRGVTFRVTPAEEREIRKAGNYLSAADLEELILVLRDERNYRPETRLSGIIEQIRVTDNPEGGTFLFIRLAITNTDVQSSIAQNFKLRVMPANSQGLVVKGKEPSRTMDSFKVPDDGKAGALLLGPGDNLVEKTQSPIRNGQAVTGWLRFSLPAIQMPNRPPLTAEYLRLPGVWYILSFVDFDCRPYEAVYKMK